MMKYLIISIVLLMANCASTLKDAASGTEGCSCCQDVDGHREHKKTLAKLLKVSKYKDGSGYDFGRFKTPEK